MHDSTHYCKPTRSLTYIIANQPVVLRSRIFLLAYSFYRYKQAAGVFSETNLNTILAFIKEALQWLHLIYNQNLSKFLQISTLTSSDSFLQRIP